MWYEMRRMWYEMRRLGCIVSGMDKKLDNLPIPRVDRYNDLQQVEDIKEYEILDRSLKQNPAEKNKYVSFLLIFCLIKVYFSQIVIYLASILNFN